MDGMDGMGEDGRGWTRMDGMDEDGRDGRGWGRWTRMDEISPVHLVRQLHLFSAYFYHLR